MVTITDKNLCWYGYGTGVLNSKKEEGTFYWAHSQIRTPVLNFKEECYRTARIIKEAAGQKTIGVLLSGGLDSEVVCRSFLDQGIDFEAFSFKYTDGSLEHETKFIDDFVSRFNIKHSYLTRDWYEFALSKEGRALFDDSEHTISVTLPRVYLANQIALNGGFPVSGIDLLFERKNQTWFMTCTEKEVTPLYKFSLKRGIDSAYLFFIHTPEIVYSFLKEPEIFDMGMGLDPIANKFRLRHTGLKYQVYKRYWPDIKVRPKFTHYSRLISRFEQIDAELNRNRSLAFNDIYQMPFCDLLQSLDPSSCLLQ